MICSVIVIELGCEAGGGEVATGIGLFRWQAVGSGYIMASVADK